MKREQEKEKEETNEQTVGEGTRNERARTTDWTGRTEGKMQRTHAVAGLGTGNRAALVVVILPPFSLSVSLSLSCWIASLSSSFTSTLSLLLSLYISLSLYLSLSLVSRQEHFPRNRRCHPPRTRHQMCPMGKDPVAVGWITLRNNGQPTLPSFFGTHFLHFSTLVLIHFIFFLLFAIAWGC